MKVIGSAIEMKSNGGEDRGRKRYGITVPRTASKEGRITVPNTAGQTVCHENLRDRGGFVHMMSHRLKTRL